MSASVGDGLPQFRRYAKPRRRENGHRRLLGDMDVHAASQVPETRKKTWDNEFLAMKFNSLHNLEKAINLVAGQRGMLQKMKS